MTVKITLITPPDIFQNDNDSIFLVNLTESEQNMASAWLGRLESNQNFNIYFLQSENETPWILHAMASSKYKYINTDKISGAAGYLSGYMLGKPNTFYSCRDLNVAAVYSYINPNKVEDVEEFFERTLGAKE
jgi:hypothetical protein